MVADKPEPNQPASGGTGTPMGASEGPVNEPTDIPPNQSNLNDTHPATDTNIQQEEQYEETIAGAAEVSDDSRDKTVPGYEPDHNSQA